MCAQQAKEAVNEHLSVDFARLFLHLGPEETRVVDVQGDFAERLERGGQVFEKDLGKNGATIAQSMKSFDPDSSWKEVEVPAATASN